MCVDLPGTDSNLTGLLMTHRKTLLTIALTGALLALAPTTQANVSYTVLDLGDLGGSNSYGTAINSSGQVAGYSATKDGWQHAFVTQNNNMVDLGTLGVNYINSFGYGINDRGQVVGKNTTSDGQSYAAFVTINGNMTGISNTFGGNVAAMAYDINNSGQITGYASGTPVSMDNGYGVQVSGITPLYAFVTQNGVMTKINNNDNLGISSIAYSINDNGDTTGVFFSVYGGGPLPFESQGTMNIALGGGYNGRSINNSGQVTGSDGGFYNNYGINDSGQIVGDQQPSSAQGTRHAFVTQNGVMTDLNNLITDKSGWMLLDARAINNNGQITGSGTNALGQTHAYLLTPVSAVPVPAAFWLFGSALLGLTGLNRRKQATV